MCTRTSGLSVLGPVITRGRTLYFYAAASGPIYWHSQQVMQDLILRHEGIPWFFASNKLFDVMSSSTARSAVSTSELLGFHASNHKPSARLVGIACSFIYPTTSRPESAVSRGKPIIVVSFWCISCDAYLSSTSTNRLTIIWTQELPKRNGYGTTWVGYQGYSPECRDVEKLANNWAYLFSCRCTSSPQQRERGQMPGTIQGGVWP